MSAIAEGHEPCRIDGYRGARELMMRLAMAAVRHNLAPWPVEAETLDEPFTAQEISEAADEKTPVCGAARENPPVSGGAAPHNATRARVTQFRCSCGCGKAFQLLTPGRGDLPAPEVQPGKEFTRRP